MQPAAQSELDPRTRAFYERVLDILGEAGIPFLVGGAYALAPYTGITRHTKDFDLFARPDDARRVLAVLAAAGYRTEVTYSHWLGKAFADDAFIDVIFNSGNGLARVDDAWFEHAAAAEVLDRPVRLVPAEEMLWVKTFVMARDRFDGADVAHLLRATGERLDWPRLLQRFDRHWRVLLSHLILFGFIYPGERARLPAWVMDDLLGRLRQEQASRPPAERLCQGTLLTPGQYAIDIEQWGYADARLRPWGSMTAEQADQWDQAPR